MESIPRLRTDGLTLAYDRTEVVRQLSLAIPDGVITALVGPNGCGKSTLLRGLARLMKARSGGVYLDGELIQRSSTRDVARRLGLLPQQATMTEGITVEDLVRRGRYPHQSFFQPPTDSDQVAVEWAMERAGVTDLRSRPVDELSGGQRQRAWIAMTLAQDTPLLLLDEPTTFLDLAHQQEVLDLVQHLNREEGRTIVMVLHDLNQAARVSDHMIALKVGQIVAQGAPDTVVGPELVREVFGVSSETVLSHDGRPLCIAAGTIQSLNGTRSRHATGSELRAERLSVGYGKHIVVEEASTTFPSGAITAVVGANACGKSTLLRALARLLPPKSGAALLDGEPVHRGSRKKLAQKLGILPQSPVTPPDLTVGELVAAGRFPHQRWWRQWSDVDKHAVERAMRATGVAEMRDLPLETLSGGQRQRAWLAMALAQDTPTLLLDEPTTFLDIAQQVEVLDLVHRMNREEGRTIVMVLHDLGHAAHYADHLVAMRDGQIVASGPSDEVFSEELVEHVFGVSCRVHRAPVSGAPIVIPAAPSQEQEQFAVSKQPAGVPELTMRS